MVGSTGSWGVERALAMARISSRMDEIVAASVDRIQERSDGGAAVLLMSSFSTFLGLPGLYLLLSMRQVPVKNVVMALWVYWLLGLRGSMSLLIAAVMWSHILAHAVKQASAMVVWCKTSQTTDAGASVRDSWSTDLAIL